MYVEVRPARIHAVFRVLREFSSVLRTDLNKGVQAGWPNLRGAHVVHVNGRARTSVQLPRQGVLPGKAEGYGGERPPSQGGRGA